MKTAGKHVKESKLKKEHIIAIAASAVVLFAAIILIIVFAGGKDQEDREVSGIVDDTQNNDNGEKEQNDKDEENQQDTQRPDPDDDKDKEEDPVDDPDPVVVQTVNPLTGEAVEMDISSFRPYAVMVNNLKSATPQSGISKADIIYEIEVEGGITRMLAIYQDITETGVIGSVRSARPYFIDIAQGLDAIYIHAGGSNDAYSLLNSRDIESIDAITASGSLFYRDSWRKENIGYEHSLMLDTSEVADYVSKNKVDTLHESGYESSMLFSDEPQPEGQNADSITVTLSSQKQTIFEYDEAAKLYKASQYGTSYIDSEDGAVVSPKNIIIIETSITKIPGDTAGRMKAILTGIGKGYFACEGKITEINWAKSSEDSQFTYTLKDGTAVEFGRGMTYVCIIPVSDGDVTYN